MSSYRHPSYGPGPNPREASRQQQSASYPAAGRPQPHPSQPDPYGLQPAGQPAYLPRPGPPQQSHPARPPAPRPEPPQRSIPAVTTPEVPGRQIVSVVGDVIGVITRSRVQPQAPGGQQQARAVAHHESILTRSRQDAIDRMITMAIDAGANAVVGVRFDSSEISQAVSEVSAYGTGVVLANGQAADHRNPHAEAGNHGQSRGRTDAQVTSGPAGGSVGEGSSSSQTGGTDWQPRSGTGTLLGDRERSDRHAATSPVLPGHPDRDA